MTLPDLNLKAIQIDEFEVALEINGIGDQPMRKSGRWAVVHTVGSQTWAVAKIAKEHGAWIQEQRQICASEAEAWAMALSLCLAATQRSVNQIAKQVAEQLPLDFEVVPGAGVDGDQFKNHVAAFLTENEIEFTRDAAIDPETGEVRDGVA